MPELPEVETVRRGLEPVLTGAVFTRVEQRRADLRFPFPKNFAERLAGRTIARLTRRAKYLLAHLDNGEVLVMHMGMSGRFTVHKMDAASKAGNFTHANGSEPRHDHVVFHMSGGAEIRFNDARRFGFMTLVASDELDRHKFFRELGPEPLGNELHAPYLANIAIGRAVPLKAFLLDQKTVAGLGNIYVCEALFRARLSPRRKAACLAYRDGRPTPRAERLVTTIKSVLNEAIAAGGSTLRDYHQADGSLGYFQHAFQVYDREGAPCPSRGCGTRIRRITQSGRSSFYCPACQR